MLEMKTVITSYAISILISTVVMALLWLQNRKRYAGIGLWLSSFILLCISVVLINLRDDISDFLSIIVGNVLVISGLILMLIGLEQFVGKPGVHSQNAILLVVFIIIHAYFTYIQPSLSARNINVATAMFFIFLQMAWLILGRLDKSTRTSAWYLGLIAIVYCLVSIVRIELNLSIKPENNFLQSSSSEALLFLIYQGLLITTSFSLLLFVNRRLVTDLEQDIINREHAETFLLDREALYHQMFDRHSATKLLIDPHSGQIVEANPAAANFYGYPKETLQQMSIKQINSMAFEEIAEWLQEAEHNKKNYFIAPHRLASGEIRTVEIYSVPIQIKQRLLLYSIIHDITERQRAEEALSKSESRLAQAHRVAKIGQYEWDFETGKIAISSQLNEILGLNPDITAITAEEFTSTLHPHDRETFSPGNIQNLIAQGHHELEFRIINQNTREKKFVYLWGETVYSSNGSAEAFTGIVQDISERKFGEEALLRWAAIEERQRLARNLHDSVTQSLHGLVLFTDTLGVVLEKNNPERLKQITSRLQASARQALKEMRLMLYELQPSPFEKDGSLINALEKRLASVERRSGVEAQLIQRGITVYPVDWRENLFWITIEALNNSLKYAQARVVTVTLDYSPQQLELEISDNGKGFDPTHERVGGLGLRNMHDRAEALGGELIVNSSPEAGTQIRFSAKVKA